MGNNMLAYDLVVIGAGPGGYVAAIRGAQLGMKVAIIESESLGGTCLNWGCIPTKSLLKSGELFKKTHELSSYGIETSDIVAHIQVMVQRSREVAKKLSHGIQMLLQKNSVTVHKGWGYLFPKEKDLFSIAVFPEYPSQDASKASCEKIIQSKKVIIASGARSRKLPELFPEKNPNIWTSKEAMLATEIPKKLFVIGGGAIGIEFANFYNALGTHVTVMEAQPRILMTEDDEIALLAQKSFQKRGMEFLVQHQINSFEEKAGQLQVTVTPKGKETPVVWQGEKILLAIGVEANTHNMGLEKTKVRIDSGRITVNAYNETDEKGLYAIGDVTAGPWLAHKASHEGVLCVEAMMGLPVHPMDRSCIPACVYSTPQIASVGLKEEDARQKGYSVQVGRFPFSANGQAMAYGETEGMIKVLFDEKTGELLGAHMLGHGVTELIQGFVIAKTLEATKEDLQHMIFPHPTLSEAMHEACLDADHRALHKA